MNAHYDEKYQAVLRYHDIPGEKLPILFIHGLGCASSSDYPSVVANQYLLGHRCIMVDLFGAGFSDHPPTFAYSVEAHAKALLGLIEAIKLTKFAVFGHSAGGAIAIALASLSQERVEKIILSEPNLDTGGGFFSQGIANQPLADYCEHGHQQQIQDCISNDNHVWAGTMQVANPRAVHQLSSSLMTGSIPSWRQQLIAFPRPKMVLFGEYSLPDDDYTKLPKVGVQVDVIPESGHSMLWENPSAVAKTIANFIL
ncbi:alpha/beta fold hydrolase [Agarivorans sp. QJM3NY_33]|uniref:alpha/beta fold hydrolase n=1 Tax=Agarivorans sp. QJM3NY_33 TaxID=3421432 RepID=UPI003D7CBCBB